MNNDELDSILEGWKLSLIDGEFVSSSSLQILRRHLLRNGYMLKTHWDTIRRQGLEDAGVKQHVSKK